ncbi:MAG: dihydrodipicolinate synthase family protein [Planctomycetia bacterium]|nr:dihydrodipicolinate synthase family protein [Planctomycetia bacterium]
MNKHEFTRRTMLGTVMTGAIGAAIGTWSGSENVLRAAENGVSTDQKTATNKEILGDPRIRGPFPILSTAFTESGEVDYEVLARQARFVDWCDCHGMIWPQSGDSVDYLTMEEKLKGMEVLAETMKGRKSALCLGVQGKNTEEMLVYARKAEELDVPAIISRPPDEGKTEDDMYEYWRALAKIVKRPVIIQTTGGTAYKGPAPSVKLLVQLAKESEFFGYVKEESNPVMQRMRELIAAKPTIKRVMSAWGGFGWLHQCRLGTEGLVTERCAYSDLLGKMWNAYDAGDYMTACDMFSKLEFMLNLKETIPGNQLRSFHLYVLQKRGVFKNRLSRSSYPKNGVPDKSIVFDTKLSQFETDEIDMRLEFIKPSLKQGTFPG